MGCPHETMLSSTVTFPSTAWVDGTPEVVGFHVKFVAEKSQCGIADNCQRSWAFCVYFSSVIMMCEGQSVGVLVCCR